jgi:ribosome biogenesis protein BRX1
MESKLRMKRKMQERGDGTQEEIPDTLTKKIKPVNQNGYTNKQRVLVFGTRGITPRFRHLLEDFRKLMPHHKKDVKFDAKGNLTEVNEIAEIKSCNSTVLFETRKRRDLYIWMSNTPSGPSAKFHAINVHTMEELKLTGNCLNGSRPLLSFSSDFAKDDAPHLGLLRCLFTNIFGCPRNHPKSKPFIDRVMTFSVLDGRIWIRNYQIADNPEQLKQSADKKEELVKLIEIGPRVVLNCIRIFDGSFGGRTIYQNPEYISPNTIRLEKNNKMGNRYANKARSKKKNRARQEANVPKKTELHDVFHGDEDQQRGEEDGEGAWDEGSDEE